MLWFWREIYRFLAHPALLASGVVVFEAVKELAGVPKARCRAVLILPFYTARGLAALGAKFPRVHGHLLT